MSEFEDGTLVKCRAWFQDPDTLLDADPTTVTVIVTSPLGVSTSYVYGTDAEVQLESSGHYRTDVDTTASVGTWVVRWAPSGNYQGAEEQTFFIF